MFAIGETADARMSGSGERRGDRDGDGMRNPMIIKSLFVC